MTNGTGETKKPQIAVDSALCAHLDARWNGERRDALQRDVLRAVRLHVAEKGDAQVTAMLLLELGVQAVIALGYTRADVDQLVAAAVVGPAS